MNRNAVIPKDLWNSEVTTKNIKNASKSKICTYRLCKKCKSMNISNPGQISFVNQEFQSCQNCTANGGLQLIKLERAPKPIQLPHRCVSGISINLMNRNTAYIKSILKNESLPMNIPRMPRIKSHKYDLCRKPNSTNITKVREIGFEKLQLLIKGSDPFKPKKLPHCCVSGKTTNVINSNAVIRKHVLKNEASTTNSTEALKSKSNDQKLCKKCNPLDIAKPNEVSFDNTKLQSCQNCAAGDGLQSNKSNATRKPKKLHLKNIVVVQKLKLPHQVNYIMQPLASLRVGKKLLVVDLDQTLCDFLPQCANKIRFDESRPYLTNFICTAYQHYDIVIWSATEKLVIIDKVHKLELFSRQSKILSYLDIEDMRKITIQGNKKLKEATVKPLELVWNQVGWYNYKNTLIIDDQSINFFLNPKNGLKIKPYFRSNFKTDNELVPLAKYLVALAKNCSDFTTVNHKNWKLYKPNK